MIAKRLLSILLALCAVLLVSGTQACVVLAGEPDGLKQREVSV